MLEMTDCSQETQPSFVVHLKQFASVFSLFGYITIYFIFNYININFVEYVIVY